MAIFIRNILNHDGGTLVCLDIVVIDKKSFALFDCYGLTITGSLVTSVIEIGVEVEVVIKMGVGIVHVHAGIVVCLQL